ncbi:hypothetical protein RclHR1_14220005 [Rhizophagus clarus]|uniref:Uncharacterized protein n=1 Tax=Rhizophagus clarus TaxID=94130 RepID=A0A2Z6R4N0_9GLOM|nr:hypothetical protein RclHR1_14220005 [Rhizophagus clarus]GES78742.1 hypothetical protein RCL_e1901_RclHR1_14220005 [Rhizophagus clarus]
MEDLGNLMYQLDVSMNFDETDKDFHRLLDNSLNVTPPRNIILTSVISLTKSQKRSAKKKACKEKQKLQSQSSSGLDEQVVSTFSIESPKYTPSKPSGSRMVTFNKSLFSPSFTLFRQLKQDSKPQLMPIDNGKKVK